MGAAGVQPEGGEAESLRSLGSFVVVVRPRSRGHMQPEPPPGVHPHITCLSTTCVYAVTTVGCHGLVWVWP